MGLVDNRARGVFPTGAVTVVSRALGGRRKNLVGCHDQTVAFHQDGVGEPGLRIYRRC